MAVNHFFAAAILVNCILAANWGIYGLTVDMKQKKTKALICALAAASAIWSAGFGLLCLCTDVEVAFVLRAIGMAGVYGYLIISLLLIAGLAMMPTKIMRFLHVFAGAGAVVIALASTPGQAEFRMSEWGMTYSLNDGIINSFYTVYSIVLAAIAYGMIIHYIKNAKAKRFRKLAICSLISETVIVAGMILDTILPMMGMDAIPGSTIAQFYGYCALLTAILSIEKTTATVTNMSQFVYRSLSLPVFVYDANQQINLVNDAAVSFFGIDRETYIENKEKITDLFEDNMGNLLDSPEDMNVVQNRCRKNQADCIITIDKIRDDYQDIIGYIVAVEDISEQVAMMKQLEQANHAKDVFLANMSHEMRTPLNSIIGFTELMLLEQKYRHSDELKNIKESAYSLLGTINEILDVTKIELGEAGVEAKREKPDRSGISEQSMNGETVLAVDDNAVNLKVIKKCLEKYGLNVDISDTGAGSIELCKTKQYALIFMDQMMPEMDGIEAMKHIRQISEYYAKGGQGKIIALTANAINGTREEMLKCGFDEYLSKPIEFPKLEEMLNRFLKREGACAGNDEEAAEQVIHEKVTEPVMPEEKKEPELIEEAKEPDASEEENGWMPGGVDINRGLELCGGDMDTYLEILKLMVETGREKLQGFPGQIQEREKNYQIDIHAVKGMCYNVGANPMGDRAKELEMAAKAQDWIQIEENHPVFAKDFELFLDSLEMALAKKGIVCEKADSEKETDFNGDLKKIQTAMENFDFPEAGKIVDQLRKAKLTKEQADMLEDISKMVEDIDTDMLVEYLKDRI